MPKITTPLHIHQMSSADFERMFPDDSACTQYLIQHRWPDGVKCPRCGNTKVHEHTKPFHWQCYACSPGNVGYRFSALVGTIFENTNKPLRVWFRVIHLMLTSKKGMSALQICRFMGFGSYKTAWYMCHRIRVALAAGDFQSWAGLSKWMKHLSAASRGTSTTTAAARERAGLDRAKRLWLARSAARVTWWLA